MLLIYCNTALRLQHCRQICMRLQSVHAFNRPTRGSEQRIAKRTVPEICAGDNHAAKDVIVESKAATTIRSVV